MHIETVIVLLFALAAGVALIARWLRLPYTVALVIAGLLLGGTHRFPAPHLSKELVFTVFLPGLLFEAAFHLEWRRFWANKLTIHALAVPGVAAAIAVTAFILTPIADALHFVEGFTLAHGFVFAALIAATDPIAVVGLFKTVGAPKRLSVLVEGESLLNDGTAVVFFALILDIFSGRNLSLAAGVADFAKVVGVGAVVGTAVSFAASKVIQKVDDPMVEITLTTVAAYGSFVLAEQFHASGVIATVVAGMICGNYATETGMSPTTRLAVESFWEYLAFALNSFIFLLIGLQVHVDDLVASWKPILAAYLAVTLGRAIVVWLVALLLRRSSERIPPKWTLVLVWGGLRGGISMVLALGLPPDFAHRDLIITMTFGVVVLSILVQGFTAEPLLRKLGLTKQSKPGSAFDLEEGTVIASRAALSALDDLVRTQDLPPAIVARLRKRYERKRNDAAARRKKLLAETETSLVEQERTARRRLLHAEKDALKKAHHEGAISDAAFEELARKLDAEMVRVDAEASELVRPEPDAGGSGPPPADAPPPAPEDASAPN